MSESKRITRAELLDTLQAELGVVLPGLTMIGSGAESAVSEGYVQAPAEPGGDETLTELGQATAVGLAHQAAEATRRLEDVEWNRVFGPGTTLPRTLTFEIRHLLAVTAAALTGVASLRELGPVHVTHGLLNLVRDAHERVMEARRAPESGRTDVPGPLGLELARKALTFYCDQTGPELQEDAHEDTLTDAEITRQREVRAEELLHVRELLGRQDIYRDETTLAPIVDFMVLAEAALRWTPAGEREPRGLPTLLDVVHAVKDGAGRVLEEIGTQSKQEVT